MKAKPIIRKGKLLCVTADTHSQLREVSTNQRVSTQKLTDALLQYGLAKLAAGEIEIQPMTIQPISIRDKEASA